MSTILIAEIGHNHNGNMELAKDMILSSADHGAHMVKFQLYDIDKIKKPGDTNYDELKETQLSREQFMDLYNFSDKYNIPFFVSVFDEERLSWLKDLNVPAIKIALRTSENHGLVKSVLAEGKHTIISGTPQKYDTDTKIDWLFCISRRDILRHGFSEHNLPEFNINGYTGFSDHCIGINIAKTAILKGATIIEKHYTHNQNARGWDQAASMLPQELLELRRFSDAYSR